MHPLFPCTPQSNPSPLCCVVVMAARLTMGLGLHQAGKTPNYCFPDKWQHLTPSHLHSTLYILANKYNHGVLTSLLTPKYPSPREILDTRLNNTNRTHKSLVLAGFAGFGLTPLGGRLLSVLSFLDPPPAFIVSPAEVFVLILTCSAFLIITAGVPAYPNHNILCFCPCIITSGNLISQQTIKQSYRRGSRLLDWGPKRESRSYETRWRRPSLALETRFKTRNVWLLVIFDHSLGYHIAAKGGPVLTHWFTQVRLLRYTIIL